jgi:hypothetical protein
VFLPCLASAQQVWVVDDTLATGPDFAVVQDAIEAAAEGDLLLVRAGDYPAFVVDHKSLTVVADAGASVHVQGYGVRNLGASQSVAILGIDAGVTQAFVPGNAVVEITGCAGPVLVQGGTISGLVNFAILPLEPTVVVAHCQAATFVGSTLLGRRNVAPSDSIFDGLMAPALVANHAQVQVAHGSVLGADGKDSVSEGTFLHQALPGATAAELTASRLVLLGAAVKGGQGGDGAYNLASQACSVGAGGGTALALDAASEADARATTISGGAGGKGGESIDFGPTCANGVAGAAKVGDGVVIALAGGSDALELDPAVVREGGGGTLALHGSPGATALLLVGFGQLQAWIPGHGGVLLPAAPLVIPLGPIPVQGTLSLHWFAPALPAGVEGLFVVLQSATGTSNPMLLGGFSPLVILDETL